MDSIFFNDYYYNAESDEITEHDNLIINNSKDDIVVRSVEEVE